MARVHTVIELSGLPSRLTYASRLLRTALGSSPAGTDQCSYHNCGSACSIDSPAVSSATLPSAVKNSSSSAGPLSRSRDYNDNWHCDVLMAEQSRLWANRSPRASSSGRAAADCCVGAVPDRDRRPGQGPDSRHLLTPMSAHHRSTRHRTPDIRSKICLATTPRSRTRAGGTGGIPARSKPASPELRPFQLPERRPPDRLP